MLFSRGALDRTPAHNKTNSETIVGKATTSQLKPSPVVRRIELFVFRQSPDSSENVVCDSVSKIFNVHIDAGKLSASNVKCVKLDTKYNSYASFHVSLAVNAECFNDIITCVMDPEMWPLGIMVRRFYNQTKHHS